MAGDYLYVEKHHIIPRFQDGRNDKDNLVIVLPEEHIVLHQVRYKAFDNRGDMLAVRFSLNGITGGAFGRENLASLLTKKVRSGYAWIKQNSSEFRRVHGWHTVDGVKRISESRKGTMPVKDLKTGVVIGSVSVNHPNVLDGRWVHCSKGRRMTNEELMNRPSMKGSYNHNYKDFATVEFLLNVLHMYVDDVVEENYFRLNKFDIVLK